MNSCVKNKLAEELVKRIQRAHREQDPLKIYVIIPAYPGFNGDVCDSNANVLRVQIKLVQDTICRGSESIFEILRSRGIEPNNYIRFFSLRNHAKLNSTPVTEMIYIHSKLMIVDDKYAILGSANFNDRSMLGSRDSEMAVLIEDTQKTKKDYNGRTLYVSNEVMNMRMARFARLAGSQDAEEVADPSSEEFWNMWNERAELNQRIYREVFRTEPDNTCETYEDVKNARAEQAKRSP